MSLTPVAGPPPGGTSDMPGTRPERGPSRRRIWIARGIAMAADAVQLLLVPLFAAGLVFPVDEVVDVVIALVMVWLVGWHWAFLPSFVAELVPMLDLFPSWTVAVWYATRSGGRRDDLRQSGTRGL